MRRSIQELYFTADQGKRPFQHAKNAAGQETRWQKKETEKKQKNIIYITSSSSSTNLWYQRAPGDEIHTAESGCLLCEKEKQVA